MEPNLLIISKFEIYSILRSRLITQDRCIKIDGKKFYFLPRLYDSFFKNFERSFTNELVYLQIQKIKMYYFDSQDLVREIVFNEITDLFFDIKEKTISIKINGYLYKLFTPINKSHEKFQLFKLNDAAFSSITIDHNPTFISYVEINKENLKVFWEISNFINSKRLTKFSKKNRDKIIEEIEKRNWREALWEELAFICKTQTLELVDKKFNKKIS
jgi:hypothetical protein